MRRLLRTTAASLHLAHLVPPGDRAMRISPAFATPALCVILAATTAVNAREECTADHASRLGVETSPDVPMAHPERAWRSPVGYTS